MKENKAVHFLIEYGLITLSVLVIVVGTYFFKFPNNFAFGGVTGFAVIVSSVFHITSGGFTLVANMLLLLLGFFFLGRKFGVKTVYASILLSVGLSAMEFIYPMGHPLTGDPLLELIFAVFLPGVGSAVLFNIGASSGGTDVIAMILKKHTSLNIGSVLFLVDVFAVALAFVVFGVTTGLFSALGLMLKSLVIDSVIENINQCKCFTIICDHADPICEFIIGDMNRSATVYEAQGAFTHYRKTVIITTMKRGQALRLRNYVKSVDPTAFILIYNSSEIIGKGFLMN